MSDSESSSSDNFEDAVESVEIYQSPTSKAKRNTMKRSSGGVTKVNRHLLGKALVKIPREKVGLLLKMNQ